MKKLILLAMAMHCTTFNLITAQAFTTGVEYLEFLNKQSEAVSRDMWDYTSSIARSRGARQVENKRQEVLKQIELSKKTIASREAYKKQDFIKDAFVNYLSLNYDILNDDYSKIVNMEEVAEQSYDLMEAYMMVQDQVHLKMAESNDNLNLQVDKYAAANDIIINENMSKLSQKMVRAGKAFDYRDPLYLIFFKANIQEANFLRALESNDLAAAEQSKNALKLAADEGVLKLADYAAYEGDGSIKRACMDALKFYQDEATTEFDKILNFHAKKENFEKLDAAIKSKKKSEVTKADTDLFNKAVNEYNSAVKSSNTTNNTLNQKRGLIINNWNKSNEDFLQKHAA